MACCPLCVNRELVACSVVFAGFSSKSLRARIIDGKQQDRQTDRERLTDRHITIVLHVVCRSPASADVVITSDEGVRGGKVIPLKQTVDEAVHEVEEVRRVFVAKRTGAAVKMESGRDVWLEEVSSDMCSLVMVDHYNS